MADNSTHHRVWLPGPIVGKAEFLDHPASCPGPGCPAQQAFDAWVATSPYIAVEGDYFTTDGRNFERCAFQPLRRR